ncbi:tetratricopeptide repeat protein [Lyngbya aestuarii]|uniref:tetratricopeptide repeat protein n=1 Tax=Lyngbya aestuarii TaxID=118322 RepID=UPI00403E0288
MINQQDLENKLNRYNQVIGFYPNDPKAYIRRGMVNFKLAKIEESIQDFDEAERLEPAVSPYLWQRGLSYYYAERFEEGAKQFELDLSVNPQDVEETVWRYLCLARCQGIVEARNSLLAVENDPRLIMSSVYELYAGNCTTDEVMAAGQQQGKRGQFYSYLYLGLYYEAQSNVELARNYIVQAVNDYQLDDYMWNLASVHQKLRGWV